MKVLLTGATGLLGRAVVSRLLQRDHDVVVLSRDPEGARRRLGAPVTVHRWEPTEGPPDVALLAGIEAVVSLAGEPVADRRWSTEQKRRIRESRVIGTRHLAEALKQRRGRPVAFVSASATGYYGDRGDDELHESSAPGTGFLAEVCRDWESEAKAVPYGQARLVTMRFGIVLSGRGGALRKLVPIFASRAAGPLGSGRQWMSWIHLDDAADLVVAALENPALEGPVNAVSPSPVTNADFTRLLAAQLRVPAFLRAPASALRAMVGEMADALLSSQRVLPDKALASGFRFRFPKLEDALRDLLPDGVSEELYVETWVPSPVDRVFAFFADEANLAKLTPPWFEFQIVGKSTPRLAEGTLLDYKMKVKGIPLKWKSRIERWEPNRSFVDVQLRGPFSRWRHTHSFVAVKGGTLVRDRIHYSVPGGAVGRGLLGGMAQKDLEKTFRYRREQLEKAFAGASAPSA